MPEQLPIAGPMLGAALTVVGLLISWLLWRRKGAAAGLRGISWSLLPLAAGLMGLMTILWRLVGDLVGFFASLVFNPVVWAGLVLLGLAVVLWIVSGVMRSRGGGSSSPSGGGRKAKDAKDAEKAGGAGGKQAAQGEVGAGTQQASGGGEDFSDVEELLRKHGIE
ncbi:hypothetical protein FHX37_1745 [Haloactinospora alba]|uniref:Cellulose synthase n=1 Tax=Haloactinospora alba TaxID=405555 RepID=A0A543NJ74_9ACTN|nr:cellulose synthase [Haloactinospora alba]TQN31824.1 hypothetical protein FHX37_1745 [Haloactinospora alba]